MDTATRLPLAAQMDGPAATFALLFIGFGVIAGGIVLLIRLGPFLDSLADRWEQDLTEQGWIYGPDDDQGDGR